MYILKIKTLNLNTIMKNNKPSFIQVFPILTYITVFLLILVALLFAFRDKNVENFDKHIKKFL